MAHDEPQMLQKLIDEIDDERAHIFVHIDRKAPFDGSALTSKRSRLTVLPQRIDGRWGDYSLVEIELALLQTALDAGDYRRLHLLSGMDMLVAPIDRIIAESHANPTTEYIAIAPDDTPAELRWRSQHRFLFPRQFQSSNIAIRTLRRLWALVQSATGYQRCPLQVTKGSQWWSITDSFARYILKNRSSIEYWFRATYCPDEMVFQTLCINSEFGRNLHCSPDEFECNRRYIRWVDGQLMPLTAEDIKEARDSGRWFARKRPHK